MYTKRVRYFRAEVNTISLFVYQWAFRAVLFYSPVISAKLEKDFRILRRGLLIRSGVLHTTKNYTANCVRYMYPRAKYMYRILSDPPHHLKNDVSKCCSDTKTRYTYPLFKVAHAFAARVIPCFWVQTDSGVSFSYID